MSRFVEEQVTTGGCCQRSCPVGDQRTRVEGPFETREGGEGAQGAVRGDSIFKNDTSDAGVADIIVVHKRRIVDVVSFLSGNARIRSARTGG